MVTAVVVAVVTGLLVVGQTTLLGRAALRLHPLLVSVLVNLGGLLAGATWVALRTRDGLPGDALGSVIAGWWWLLAGGLGWLVLGGLAAASARLGVGAALAVVVAAQVLGGVLVDARTGAVPLDVRGLLGALLVAAGVWLLAGRTA